MKMNKRKFLKSAAALSSIAFLPSCSWDSVKNGKIRTAHIGVGNMGAADLEAISSHSLVEVAALVDVDTNHLAAASKLHPGAKTFSDYRKMLDSIGKDIDAVVVSTPDHTHAPAAMLAMEHGKNVYCQKPLTHHVSESRAMDKYAKENNIITQMGIQVHSFYDYKLATLLIQSGIIGKVSVVRAWSPKTWGYDGPLPEGSDPIPTTLDWNLWQGTAPERPFKEDLYHPMNWRRILDYGCGTLGDMGVHIFDTPYNALNLDVPYTIVNSCREPNGFSFPGNNKVTYEFPGTEYTADKLTWIWYDGPGSPETHEELALPNGDQLPEQGAMFVGEKGKLLLPHFMELPRLIVDGKYEELDLSGIEDIGPAVRNYETEGKKHYHQFVDACLGKDECSAPFSYAARLTETILLGVIAGRYPNQTLNWDRDKAQFAENDANQFLYGDYRSF